MNATRDEVRARQRLSALGARVTAPRVRVMAALLGAKSAMSRQDIAAALPAPMDKVTLYRVLDWLVGQGAAHRHAGEDRLRRYMLSDARRHEHPHFHCSGCGRVLCLEGAARPAPPRRLPRGFRPQSVEVTVRGLCVRCA